MSLDVFLWHRPTSLYRAAHGRESNGPELQFFNNEMLLSSAKKGKSRCKYFSAKK